MTKALRYTISLLMLVVITTVATLSTVSDFRSHSLSGLKLSSHSHVSTHLDHGYDINEKAVYEHDASSHNHINDNAMFKLGYQLSALGLLETYAYTLHSGLPIRNPFKIERPPRTPFLPE
ncbi:hypothetical protein [Vibrio sp. M60_M70]|uniref:hypothetical protein n=1 Tax=Vibrio sp. M60_M70 TaxID=3035166 RepID=UPI00301D75BF